jgi:proliferating cell nuclear antigen PCNA
MTEETFDNMELYIRSIKVQPLKQLFLASKEIIGDTNLIFTPNEINCVDMDKTRQMLIDLNLEAEKFEKFICKRNKIVVGLNIANLCKIIAMVELTDSIVFYIDRTHYNDGNIQYLGVRAVNGNGKCGDILLKLIETDLEEIRYPSIRYSSVINMQSSDLNKLIRDYNNVGANKMEIISVKNTISFKCNSTLCQHLHLQKVNPQNQMKQK